MAHIRSTLQTVFAQPAYREAISEISAGRGPVVLAGLTPTAKALFAAGLAHDLLRPVIFLTSDNDAADRMRVTASTIMAWLDGPPALAGVSSLPAFDCSPYEGRSPHAEISERRAVAMWNLSRGQTRILFAPLPAALGRFRDRSYYRSLALELKPGEELNLDDLVEHLKGVGYESGEPVQNPGQFSLRGGIIDIFPPESEWPFRIEFFGDLIESLREFDPTTQRSRAPVNLARLLPLNETKHSPEYFELLVRNLMRRRDAESPGTKVMRSEKEPEWASSFLNPFPGWEFLSPLVEPHESTLFSLFDRPILIWDEPDERRTQLLQTLEKLRAAFEEVRDVEPPPPDPNEIFLSETEFNLAVERVTSVSVKELGLHEVASNLNLVAEGVPAATAKGLGTDSSAGLPPKSEPDLIMNTAMAPKYHGEVKPMMEDLRQRFKHGEAVTFVIPTAGKAERLRDLLGEYEIPFESEIEQQEKQSDLPQTGGSETPPKGSPENIRSMKPMVIARGEMGEGVAFPDLGILLLSDNDLFGGFDWGGPRRKERSSISSFLSDLSDLKVGDYVVHVDHGIGLYHGLRQLGVAGAPRDFMLLTYQDDARLYVPLERLDLVEKYRRSGDASKPALDRLGGTTWERTKTRVKRSLRDMAEELLRLYAERKMRGGVAYSPDSAWQREFEDAFEFEETPDQLTALAELKKDLESPQPMDRLLCGDVGYGKTELAMRAAFKVAQDGKQVAVLAPTTVLAFQHYNTFRQRMAAFPVRVEMLSRFRTPIEQKQTAVETENGRVDILIGTHRMLSKDVTFRDLGLLIVDEEQRFGVAAKEKLKKLKAGVDVLTMSATPIPRTLHMSVGGLRDLSVIETPPRGRLAIQTVVASFSDGVIQAAILHEMERSGQVFFVHNRVESIFTMAALLQRLVPTARIGVAHGQMGEKELEKVMLKFIRGEYEILTATALIENGLDIPRANTIIVNHADRFGLADLYQLRGRVGRSNRRAYAYFLIPAEDALTPTAKRRLAALKEFSDLGAGFRLAALDLELRGAGNLLGAEQSGHLNSVGLDLYLQMLEQTVEELRGAPARLEVRTTINLGLDIKIPPEYIVDESQRLRMYKRISSLNQPEERAELESEMADRYGPMPPSVINLLNYSILKSVAENLLVQSIDRKSEEIWIRFHPQAPISSDKLTQFVRQNRGAAFRPDGALRFRFKVRDAELPGQLANTLRQLHQ
ncbi:MAG TPA: transcription-repair coupling factor [Terriglobia bacterium]|nr:transcription-repair coupling factor [Terriglobia bacterium]